jgi:hypothetical protein
LNPLRIGRNVVGFVAGPVAELISPAVKGTLALRALGLAKIPLIFFVSPSVVEDSETGCVIRIPLNRRTRNHLGAMYFAALCMGADLAGGFSAWRRIEEANRRLRGKRKLALIFTDFSAEFLKRAEGDVLFSCQKGPEIRELVEKVVQTGERQEVTLPIIATVPEKLGNEPVARFKITLSVK